ncbi:hypothetical protein Btru_030863 [Bulinus truncatus]|nr:hypothetical protein Btru_030863 [Bulinus truncatus]
MQFFGQHEAEMPDVVDGYFVKQLPKQCIANHLYFKFITPVVISSNIGKESLFHIYSMKKHLRLRSRGEIDFCNEENKTWNISFSNEGHQHRCHAETKLIHYERSKDSKEIFSTQYIGTYIHLVPLQLCLTIVGSNCIGNQHILLIKMYWQINFLYLIDEWMLNFICTTLVQNVFMESHLFFSLNNFLCYESQFIGNILLTKTFHVFKEVFEIQHQIDLENNRKHLRNDNFELNCYFTIADQDNSKLFRFQYKLENFGSLSQEIRQKSANIGYTKETRELSCKDASKNLCKLKQTELQKNLICNFFKNALKNSDKLHIETVKKDVNKDNNTSQDENDHVEMNILNELIASKAIHLYEHNIPGIETSQRSPVVYMLRSLATNHHPDKVMGITWAFFERETLRVASFLKYPLSSVKPASLLANSGFVYIGEGKSDKVICFYCYMVKQNWREEEDVHLVHKTASPHCPMVSVLEVNNVATTSIAGNTGHSVNESHLSQNMENANIPNYPGHSLLSSYNNPYSVTSSDPHLGSSSMSTEPQITQTHFTPVTDSQVSLESGRRGSNSPLNVATPSHVIPVSAPRTNLTQAQTPVLTPPLHLNRNIRHQNRPTQDDNSTVQHPNINSQIYSIPRLPLSVPPDHSVTNNDPPVRELNLLDLGIFHERPKKPEFAILAKREESFEGWPPDSPVSKDHVAKSGIYYEGYGDSGRCFFCGGGLRKWEKGDDPFVEHARWYPKCGYIRQYMGKAFVDIVQEIKQQNNKNVQIPRSKVLQEMHSRGLTIINEFDDPPIENDPAVKSVLDEFENTFSRDEILRIAHTLRRNGISLSADVLYTKLTENHNGQVVVPPVVGATALVANNITDDDIEGLRDENTTLRNNLVCKICMDKEVKIVFLPCGHLVSCQECAVAFVDCPICRSHIRAYVRATIR